MCKFIILRVLNHKNIQIVLDLLIKKFFKKLKILKIVPINYVEAEFVYPQYIFDCLCSRNGGCYGDKKLQFGCQRI